MLSSMKNVEIVMSVAFWEGAMESLSEGFD